MTNLLRAPLTRFFLPVAILLLTFCSSAEAASTCASITENVAPDQDWRIVESLIDENGFKWKRAIISKPQGKIQIPESGPLQISGIAGSESHVRIFIFSPTIDGFGNVQKPGDGTCFMAGTANELGAYRFQIHSSLLWQNLGEEMIVDAFYKTDETETPPPKGSLYTFSIGTAPHLPLQAKLETTADSWSETQDICTPLCEGSDYRIAAEIKPDEYANVARYSFEFPVGSQENTSAKSILLVKSAANTLHAFVKNSEIDPLILPRLNVFPRRAIVVESMKRIILGLEKAQWGTGDRLTSSVLLERQRSGSPEIKAFLTDIKTALISPAGSAERDAALDSIAESLISLLHLNSTGHFLPDRDLFAEILANREALPSLIKSNFSMTPPFSEQRPLSSQTDCPFNQFANRTIIDFNSSGIIASGTPEEGRTDIVPVTLEMGEYRMLFSSYDDHQASPGEEYEQWRLVLTDSGGNDLLFTNDVSDIPDDVDSVTETVHESIQVPAGTTGAYALHGSYPFATEESVTPVCVALDWLDPPPPPEVQTENEDIWAYDFQQIMVLWTNMIEPNPCIIPLDGQANLQFRNRTSFKQGQSDHTMCPGEPWIDSGAIGADPVVYLNRTGELVPDFEEASIIYGERPFDFPEGWRIPQAGDTVSYRYSASTPLAPAADSESCLAAADIEKYAERIGNRLDLPKAVENLIAKELENGFGKTDEQRPVILADPRDIGQRIKWKLNGRAAEIRPLFFHVGKKACRELKLAEPQMSPTRPLDGYDVGLY